MSFFNTGSLEWVEITRRCEEGKQGCLANLSRQGYPLDKTEFERGRLAAFEEILGFPDEGDDPPEQVSDTYA